MPNLDLPRERIKKTSQFAARLAIIAALNQSCKSDSAALEAIPPTPTRSIGFAGRNWLVKNGQMGPGNNQWSPENVFTDNAGLHLRITNREAEWSCSEVSLAAALGYGSDTFEIVGLEQMRRSEGVGLFIYQKEDNE